MYISTIAVFAIISCYPTFAYCVLWDWDLHRERELPVAIWYWVLIHFCISSVHCLTLWY